MENIVKPWHGIPREEIKWQPEVDEELCIGCGLCATGCGRMVYRFDYEKKKPVVVAPLNCMVACVTCANTCPQKDMDEEGFREVRGLIEEKVKELVRRLKQN